MADGSKIDYSKLDFPSDRLTIKTLRHCHPHEIDSGNSPDLTIGRDTLGELLRNLLFVERTLAEVTFNRALGRTMASDKLIDEDDVKGMTSELGDIYIRYGIANGEHHAGQLIRSIESQAVKQALELSGRRP